MGLYLLQVLEYVVLLIEIVGEKFSCHVSK